MENSVENLDERQPPLTWLLTSAWAANEVPVYVTARDGPGGGYRKVSLPPMDFSALSDAACRRGKGGGAGLRGKQ